MSNKVVQSDNAVIDYTTIQSLIDAVNGMQNDVDNIKLNQQQIIPTKTGDGTTGSIKSGPQIIDSGTTIFYSSPVTIQLNKAFNQRPNIALTVSGGKGYAYIKNGNDWLTFNRVVVYVEGIPKGSINWVAVGL